MISCVDTKAAHTITRSLSLPHRHTHKHIYIHTYTCSHTPNTHMISLFMLRCLNECFSPKPRSHLTNNKKDSLLSFEAVYWKRKTSVPPHLKILLFWEKKWKTALGTKRTFSCFRFSLRWKINPSVHVKKNLSDKFDKLIFIENLW